MTYTDLMATYITPLHPIPTGMKPSGELKAPVKAVLFDVYGTIIISQSGDISVVKNHVQSAARLNALMKAYDYVGSVDELIDNFFQTIETAHKAMRQKGIDFPEVEIDRIWMQVLGTKDINIARRFALEFEMIVNPGYPMPYLTDVLTYLQNSGRIMGIVSNAQFFTPTLFQVLCGDLPEKLGFNPGLIFYSYRHGLAKPSQRLFQLASRELEEMGIDRQNVLYMGNDMLNDILPASHEGFQTALFAGDNRSLRLRKDDGRCKDVLPNLVITALNQLKTYLT